MENTEKSSEKLQKWAGIASFLLVLAFVIAPSIYLVGKLQDAFGPFTYSMADFLYGPVWAASLVMVIFTLRKHIGKHAPMRMSFALVAAILSAGMMVLVACIRSSNRNYHLMHPDLHLEESVTILTVWATINQGVIAAGWHFLGWTLVLVGSAGWTTKILPRMLCILYLFAGIASLFVYVFPILEGFTVMLGMVWATWQGIWFWKDLANSS